MLHCLFSTCVYSGKGRWLIKGICAAELCPLCLVLGTESVPLPGGGRAGVGGVDGTSLSLTPVSGMAPPCSLYQAGTCKWLLPPLLSSTFYLSFSNDLGMYRSLQSCDLCLHSGPHCVFPVPLWSQTVSLTSDLGKSFKLLSIHPHLFRGLC